MSETQQVWDEFSTALRAFIRRRVRDDHVADDLLQDVFVRIHDKLDALDDEERMASWIFRIARNVVTDFYRRRSDDTFDEKDIATDQVTRDENINGSSIASLNCQKTIV